MIRVVTGGAQARFWARVGAARRRILDGTSAWPEKLEAALDAGYDRWRTEWIAREDFAAELGERFESESELGEVARWWDHLRAGDLYLACACARGIATALQAFEKVYADEIARIARRFQRRDLGADDLTQLLRTKLFAPPLGSATPESAAAARPKIASYTGQGFLQNWVRVTATRTFIDGVRWQHADETEDSMAADLAELLQEPAANPELRMLKQEHAAHFKAAFAEAVAALEPSDRLVLKQHLVERLTIDQIGALYHLHRATAARRVAKARDTLLAGVRVRLARRLGLTVDSLAAAFDLLASRLDASVERVLR
jgi:RNA polymerase sigma-70 factor, ECF subfamily